MEQEDWQNEGHAHGHATTRGNTAALISSLAAWLRAGDGSHSTNRTQMQRKLSDIFIELALQGLSSPKYGNSEVIHPLMMLAHIAWQRETADPEFMEGRYEKEFSKFNLPRKKLKTELICTDWNKILQRMQEYKRIRFPDDKRIVTLCAYTPRGTLRVEWK